MVTDNPDRATASTAEAAEELGLTARRVLQLLDDPSSPLEGTPGAGHGHPRRVYTDSIAHHEQTRRTPPRSLPELTDLVVNLQQTVDRLAADVADITDRPPTSPTSSDNTPQANPTDDTAALLAENERLRFELAKSDAASDALRDAITEQAAAADLHRKAADHEARARDALARAEKARDDSRPAPPV